MGIEGAKHVNEAPEQEDDFSDIKQELTEFSAELGEIREVTRKGESIILPIDWNGIEYDFVMRPKRGANSFILQIESVAKGKPKVAGNIDTDFIGEVAKGSRAEFKKYLQGVIDEHVAPGVGRKAQRKIEETVDLLVSDFGFFIEGEATTTKQKKNPEREPREGAFVGPREAPISLLFPEIDDLLRSGKHGLLKDGSATSQKIAANLEAIKREGYLDKHITYQGEKMPLFAAIKRAFAGANLPKFMRDLGPYIPMQETSYNIDANESSSGAVGLWQLKKGAATRYGLTVTSRNDQRKDPLLATEAAIRMLEDDYQSVVNNPDYQLIKKKYDLSKKEQELVESFLTINAYNAGQGHIENFLDHVKTGELPVQSYSALGIIRALTEEYPQNYAKYQPKERFANVYYHKDASEYVYKILRYYQENTTPSEGDIALAD